MKRLHSIILIVLSAIMLIGAYGCASHTKIVTTVPPKEEQPRPIINQYAYAYYVSGLLAEKEQQFQTALRSYEEALKHAPGNSEILFTLAQLQFNLRQFQAALETAQKIHYKDKDTYMLIGDCYRIFRDDEKAEAAYRKVLKMDPDNMHAHWFVAGYARNNNDYEEAIYHLEQVARINPTGRIYVEIANAYIVQSDFDKAIEAFEKSLAIDSSEANVESYIGLSTLLKQKGEEREAEEVLLRGIDINPAEPSIRVYLAEMYADLDDTVRATNQVREVMDLESEQLPMVNRAGQIAYELNQLDLADSVFEYELSLAPESVLGNYFRGRIAVFQDRPTDAKSYFRKLIEIADTLPDGYINLGMIYLDEDSLDLAIDVLREGVIRATTGREEVQFYLGTALGRAERYDEVVTIVEPLVREHPGEIRFMFMMGAALERIQNHDSAAVYFERILKIDPNHAQTLNYLGYMWADLGLNLQESLSMITKALEIDGENPAYLDSYGWVLYKLGRYEEAETNIKRAIELMNDQDSVLFDHLAEVCFSLGRYEEARANWERALQLDPDNTEIKEKLAR
jgi:tetratricopeptide (TPR) repeat protein